MKKNLKHGLAVLLIIALLGCQNKNSAETAGERVDEVVDNIKDGDPPLKHKGPMEEAGEWIDESVKQEK